MEEGEDRPSLTVVGGTDHDIGEGEEADQGTVTLEEAADETEHPADGSVIESPEDLDGADEESPEPDPHA